MRFALNTEVSYKDLCGVIDFIDPMCIVIQLPAKPGRNPARLVVYHDDFDKVIVLKDSDK